ncbi:MAG: RNA-binding protein [Thermoanaerobaculia bacterium]|nr:RNA-binding protein [Thermoanaerobaculia bacterium]
MGNLNFATTEQELRQAMSEVGQVLDVHIPTDRETGRPRGFAFVKFGSAEDVEAAIERFDGEELGGRPLRVNPAQERRSRGSRPPRRESRRAEEGGEDEEDFDGPDDSDWKSDRFRPKSKGSRKGARGKKRSL